MGTIDNTIKVCSRCVMDTSDLHITFDTNGICNHCYEYDKVVKPYKLSNKQREGKLHVLIDNIKKAGKGRKFDCIIGLSGGADSSYVAYLAYKLGLKGLIVHFDNGWDSELAIKNIENIVNKTGFEYFNYIVDWEEFKSIQRAYFKASVVDVEVPTDMAISSLIPQIALKYDVKYILSGANVENEFTMGTNWNFSKSDRSNLISICKSNGAKELKTFPYYTPFQQFLVKIKNIKTVNILAYDKCDYTLIKQRLREEFEWKDYPVKHGESIFTKFYQSYYLPKKFGIDKRKAHLSDQINSGFIDREKAMEILKTSVYNSVDEEVRELNYVTKKLGFDKKEFDEIMSSPICQHSSFSINQEYGDSVDKVFLKILKIKIVITTLRKMYRVYDYFINSLRS